MAVVFLLVLATLVVAEPVVAGELRDYSLPSERVLPSVQGPSGAASQAVTAPDAYERFRVEVRSARLSEEQRTELKAQLGQKAKTAIAGGDYAGAQYYLRLVEIVDETR